MEPCRIPVIEDDPEFRSLLDHLLTEEGHEVSVADSVLGTAAQVRQLDPSVILLDLGLPYRSGASLLAELKADARTAHIPVVIV